MLNETFQFDTSSETFSVDPETRTIKGLALPYGQVARKANGAFQFAPKTLTFSDVKRVKLLANHKWENAVGHAVALDDTEAGLVVAFKVARGEAGDQALTYAADGVWDGLSVGVDITDFEEKDGVMHVTAGRLREVSLTPCPAFDDARITSVAASRDNDKEGSIMADQVENTPALESVNLSSVTDAIRVGFESLRGEGPSDITPAAASFEVNEPTPYRFDGIAGSHSFVEDMRDAQQGNSAAQTRLAAFAQEFAVTSTNVTNLNPVTNRPDLWVPNLTYTRPLWDSVSTGTVNDKTPFTIPKFSSATGLVAPHTEGVEPTPGALSATNQTISPSPMSGKIEINREVLDQGGSPQADSIIWGEMLNAYYEAIEAKIAAQLNAVATAELNLAGATDSALQVALTNYYAGLQFVRGGNRFTGLVLDGTLFPALVAAKDSAGRPLFPVLAPSNANGTTNGGFDGIQIGNQTGRAAWALGTGNTARSFSFVPSSVWAWASAPQRFVFEYQVKSVDMAIWGYSATAVLRDSDVKPIDYTTADA